MLLSTFFLVARMPVPFVCMTDRERAIAWLAGQAHKAGLALPPSA